MIVYTSLIWYFCISVVLCVVPFQNNKLIEDLCIERPDTNLIVLGNDIAEEVVVHNDKEDVKATTRFVIKGTDTPIIKHSFRLFGKRLSSDFLPYNVTTVKLSGAGNANATTFLYKRKWKPEDQPYKITLYKGFYYSSLRGKDQQQLLGLNQVWVGCPSPMCLFGTIDAAFRDNAGVYITRGLYYWNIKGKKAPLSKDAKLITDYVPITTSVIDSAFVTGNFFFYVKDKRVYCVDKSTKKTCAQFSTTVDGNDIPTFFNVDAKYAFTPETLEAAFSFANDQSSKIGLYGEQSLSKLAILKPKGSKTPQTWYENHKVIDFPLLFQGKIDAMVAVDDKVWIFMGWVNYKIPISAMEDTSEMDSKKGISFYNFADPFGCDKGLYSGWVYDYDKYVEEMNQVVESDTHTLEDIMRRVDLLPEEQRVGTSKPSDEQSALPFILAAILLAVIIIIIIIILTEKRRRSRKKKTQETKPEEVDLRAPAMGSNLEARSVVGSVIQDEYKPGKKLSPSKIASKTSIASGVTPKGSKLATPKGKKEKAKAKGKKK